MEKVEVAGVQEVVRDQKGAEVECRERLEEEEGQWCVDVKS
jgi:hypothetical protein